MRNLKRALSLALASVMVLGLMVVGSGASYSDVTSENNQEAIEVLQEIGVMVGDDNGNFNPDSVVTRNEMAVVVSNLMDYRVATYAGTSPFTDVPAWAEPYVAACWTNGNIAGYDATTFGGSDPVTTSQAALMLMKALGYFQYESDFGSDWQLATISQGNKIDLFIDVDSNVREAMTRNDLAQLVLNTLKSGIVEADNDTIKVDAGDVKVEAGKVKYNYITSGESYAGAIKNLTTAGTVVNSGTRIVELGEKLYQGDLKMDENRSDEFGRPGTKWTYKTTSIGTFSDDPVATYTAKMSKDNLYDLLGKDVIDDYALIVYIDGVCTYVGDITTGYAQANSSSASCNSGKGVLTQVYVDSDYEIVTVVVTNTYLMQATADYNESKGTVAVTTLTTPVGGLATSVNSLADDDFAAVTEMAEDDYILYTYAQGKVQSAVKAEVLTGEVTAYSTATKSYSDAGGSVTIDGTKHDYAKFADVSSDNGCATEFSVGNNAAIVLDAYGYALYVDDAALSMGNYVYISAVAPETNLSTKVIADAYFYDGTNETITLKPGTTLTSVGSRTSVGNWYSYSINSKDEYTLTIADTTGNSAATSIANNRVALFTGTKAAGGTETVTGNSNTVFIVKDKDDKITVYTGITNVPDITLSGAGAEIGYMRDKDNASKAASLVFVDTGAAGRVKSTTDSLLYTVKKDTTFVDNSDNEKVERWFVVLDGALTTVETKETWSAKNLYEDYSKDADGYYETGSAFDTPDDSDRFTYAMSNASIKQSGDTLTLAGTTMVVGSDTEISLIMIPANKGDAYALSGEVMNDNNADYQVVENIAAKTLANTFKDRTVTGTSYVIYDDKGDSDLANRVYVVVTACSSVSSGTSPVVPTSNTGSYLQWNVSQYDVYYYGTQLTVDQIRSELERLTGKTVASYNVGTGAAVMTDGTSYTVNTTQIKNVAVKVDGTIVDYVQSGTASTAEGLAASSRYIVKGTNNIPGGDPGLYTTNSDGKLTSLNITEDLNLVKGYAITLDSSVSATYKDADNNTQNVTSGRVMAEGTVLTVAGTITGTGKVALYAGDEIVSDIKDQGTSANTYSYTVSKAVTLKEQVVAYMTAAQIDAAVDAYTVPGGVSGCTIEQDENGNITVDLTGSASDVSNTGLLALAETLINGGNTVKVTFADGNFLNVTAANAAVKTTLLSLLAAQDMTNGTVVTVTVTNTASGASAQYTVTINP